MRWDGFPWSLAGLDDDAPSEGGVMESRIGAVEAVEAHMLHHMLHHIPCYGRDQNLFQKCRRIVLADNLCQKIQN